MKATFLQYNKPLLTAMVQENTPGDAINTIMNSHYDGAEAFGIQLECLERQYRDVETLRGIFSYCMGKPIYITSYRHNNSEGMTDDECAEYLLMGIEAGATLGDVMGDWFHPEPYELTFDEEAIAKQKAIIDRIHALGGEVLISSHLHTYFTCDQLLEYAHAQRERGADVVKMVNFAQTEEQLLENIRAAAMLKHELDCPYLLLANGAHSRLLRQIGPNLGVCMYLCVQHYAANSKEQPILRSQKAVRDNMFFDKTSGLA